MCRVPAHSLACGRGRQQVPVRHWQGLSWNSDPVSLFRNEQGPGERKEGFQKVSAVAPSHQCDGAAGGPPEPGSVSVFWEDRAFQRTDRAPWRRPPQVGPWSRGHGEEDTALSLCPLPHWGTSPLHLSRSAPRDVEGATSPCAAGG